MKVFNFVLLVNYNSLHRRDRIYAVHYIDYLLKHNLGSRTFDTDTGS
jgi:hypothetical protein